MANRLKIASLLVFVLLFAGLATAAGCGGEKKPVTESQVADYNKPGIVYIVTTYVADVTVPDITFDEDALVAWGTAEVLAGRVGTSEAEIFLAIVNEVLRNPQLYVIAGPPSTDITTTMEVSSSGNGFIVSPDGYIVTVAHLIKDDEKATEQLFADQAAVDQLLVELDELEAELEITLTDEQADRFFEAAAVPLVAYIDVGDVDVDTQVYTGNNIGKARESEKGLRAETVKVGDPFELQEETGKDVAILKVNASNLPTVKLGDEASVRDGDKVLGLGYLTQKSGESEEIGSTLPKEDKPTLATGTVAGRRTLDDGWTVLQMQIPLEEGSSGSPILNTNGEAIGVMTFETVETDPETGQTTEVATEKFAIPTSIVKEFLSQSNVTAVEGPSTTTYREGVDFFHQQKYKKAKEKFETVRSTNADFPFIQDIITESQSNIDKGLDKGGLPLALIGIIAGAVIALLIVIIVIVLLMKRRKRKKGQGGPGMTGPGGGAPAGPGPGMAAPAPGAPAPGVPQQAPPQPAPAPQAPPAAPEAPTQTMPAPQPAPEPAPPQTAPPAPPAAPQGPPPAAPGTPMPGSPDDTGRR